MTTRHRAIRRENLRDWPIFAGSNIPNHFGVLSLELRRMPHEGIREAVGEASMALCFAIGDLLGSRSCKLWLLTFSKPYESTSRTAAYHAERDKLWAALEKTKIRIPAGDRVEVRVQQGSNVGYLGSVEFGVSDLPVALEVTRTANAVCVATDFSVIDPLADLIAFLASVETESPMLLSLALETLAPLFVARGFGWFDDEIVGADVFAPEGLLNELRQALGNVTEPASADIQSKPGG